MIIEKVEFDAFVFGAMDACSIPALRAEFIGTSKTLELWSVFNSEKGDYAMVTVLEARTGEPHGDPGEKIPAWVIRNEGSDFDFRTALMLLTNLAIMEWKVTVE